MIEKKVVIKNKSGLHARPASQFVKTAATFKSQLSLISDQKEVDAKSIISVLSLGVSQGKEIIIRAKGEDEHTAVSQLLDTICSIED